MLPTKMVKLELHFSRIKKKIKLLTDLVTQTVQEKLYFIIKTTEEKILNIGLSKMVGMRLVCRPIPLNFQIRENRANHTEEK